MRLRTRVPRRVQRAAHEALFMFACHAHAMSARCAPLADAVDTRVAGIKYVAAHASRHAAQRCRFALSSPCVSVRHATLCLFYFS